MLLAVPAAPPDSRQRVAAMLAEVSSIRISAWPLAPAALAALLSGLAAGMAGSPLSAVQLELELDDEPIESMLGSLADDLFPMALEPITVADDPTFLPKMVAAHNLPAPLTPESSRMSSVMAIM